MSDEAEMVRTLQDGRKVWVQITPDGEVLVQSASKVRVIFPYEEDENGLKISDSPGADTFRVDLRIGGVCSGIEAIFCPDDHLLKGRPCGLYLSRNQGGEWEVCAKDGVGQWSKEFKLT